jgi:hypothetical protein
LFKSSDFSTKEEDTFKLVRRLKNYFGKEDFYRYKTYVNTPTEINAS